MLRFLNYRKPKQYYSIYRLLSCCYVTHQYENYNFIYWYCISESDLKKPTSLPMRNTGTSVTPPRKITPKLAGSTKDPVQTREHLATKEPTAKPAHPRPLPLKEKKKGSDSDNFFLILFWMLVLTRLWMNMWILQLLLPLVVIIWMIKSLGTVVNIE